MEKTNHCHSTLPAETMSHGTVRGSPSHSKLWQNQPCSSPGGFFSWRSGRFQHHLHTIQHIAWFCICFQNTIFHSLSICPWSQTYFACPKGLTFLNDALLINNLLRWSHMTSILKKHFPCWVREGVVGLQIYVAMAHLKPHDKWRRFQFNWWINYKCVRISRIQTPY